MRNSLTPDQQRLITPELIHYADMLALRFRHCGIETEDLMQEARYGLCVAALQYNPNSGASLMTFATIQIRKAIANAIREYGRPEGGRGNDAQRANENEKSPFPQPPALFEHSLDVLHPERARGGVAGENDAQRANDRCSQMPGTETASGLKPALFALSPCEQSSVGTPKEAGGAGYAELLREMMDELLNDREKKVLMLTYGLDAPPMSVVAVSKRLKLTPRTVKRIRDRAIAKLQICRVRHLGRTD